MREAMLLFPAAILLTGCAARPTAPDGPIRTQAAPLECINLDQIVARRPSGSGSILFETTGGRVYRNGLPDKCPGLGRAGPGHIVEVESNGAQLCRGDRVRVYDPIEARTVGRGAFAQCRLGRFAPLDAERR